MTVHKIHDNRLCEHRGKHHIVSAIQQLKEMNWTNIDSKLLSDAENRIQEKKYLKYAFYYKHTQCQNKKCGKKYLKHKFDVDSLPISQNGLPEMSLKCVRKFYICKGCHLTFYCSRRCQKVDWNHFGHKRFCHQVREILHV